MHCAHEEQDDNHYNEDVENTGVSEITNQAVKEATEKLKNRKSQSPVVISNELLKNGGPQLCNELKSLFNKIPNTEKVAEKWKHSTIIPILKKDDRKLHRNYLTKLYYEAV